MKLKFDTIKIPRGNDTQICIHPVLPDGETIVPVTKVEGTPDAIFVEYVAFVIGGHEVQVVCEVDEEHGVILVPISSTLPEGSYDLLIMGSIADTIDVREDVKALFEIVPYTNSIAFEKYYTNLVIVGFPNAEIQALRRQYEQKIEEYQNLIDQLNRGEVATKSDLGLAPGETVAGLIKAGGGGGGGGLTPEQWAQIAKESTLDSIDKKVVNGFDKTNLVLGTADQQSERKGSLMQRAGWCNTTLANLVTSISTVQNKLDTIIANTSLTSAQADEDWKNVQPA